eukprot:1252203-Rhodomonas_salina.2
MKPPKTKVARQGTERGVYEAAHGQNHFCTAQSAHMCPHMCAHMCADPMPGLLNSIADRSLTEPVVGTHCAEFCTTITNACACAHPHKKCGCAVILEAHVRFVFVRPHTTRVPYPGTRVPRAEMSGAQHCLSEKKMEAILNFVLGIR